ncbi:MAG: alpha/beta hydrolase [Flavobacteriaceae bacterium]|jgi:pimeloyl-ACP methyl ester carboxylesterase|nr:alpha/beta hydrolase [Flavobacteriaceae bacterium]
MKKVVGFAINILSLFSMRKAVDIAYLLFSTPRKGKFTGDIPSFLSNTHQVQISYNSNYIQGYLWNEEEQDLPLVFLVHGWESNSVRWEQLITYLKGSYRLLCIDAMGLGASPGKNLSVIEYSRLIGFCMNQYKPSVVVAHSLGAFATLYQVCKQQPLYIKKLVLMAGLDQFNLIATNYIKLLGYNRKLTKAFYGYLEELIEMPLLAYSSQNFIDTIPCSALIIHDVNDDYVRIDECEVYHEKAAKKNIKIIKTVGLGHSLQDVSVFEEISNFIK